MQGHSRELARSSLIQNVIIVDQENHTFDNYFGTHPRAEGTVGKNICLPIQPGSSKCMTPFHDSILTPKDMNHGWTAAHEDYDDREIDAFVYTQGKSSKTMGYYDPSDVPR